MKLFRKIVNYLLVLVFLLQTTAFSTLIGSAKAVTGATLNIGIANYTWNKIGLDSNNVSVGPNQFLVQSKFTVSGTTATNVVTTATFESGNSPYIHLVSNSTQNFGDLAPGTYNAFYVVKVDRNASAYDTQKKITIKVDADNAPADTAERTLTVERLLSQNRNQIKSYTVNPPHPTVGSTFTLTMHSETSAHCFDNLATYPAYNPDILQLVSVSTTYNVGVDSGPCREGTESDIWTQDHGDDITSVLTFKALAAGTSTMYYLILDNSGNSYHYNDDYGDVNPITVSPALGITKSVDKAAASPGEIITYTLNYTNTGNAPATGVKISDSFAQQNQQYLTYIDGSGGTWFPDTKTVLFDIGTVGAGENGSVSFQAKIDEIMPIGTTIIKNLAFMASNESPIIQSNCVSTTVETNVNLEITKTAAPNPVRAGDNLTYTITFTNTGNATAHGVIMTDPIPVNTTFVSASDGGYLDSGSVIWNIGTLNSKESRQYQLVVKTDSPLDFGTVITNTVTIDSDETTPKQASVVVPIDSSPIFTLIKSDDPDPVLAGGIITYTIEYGNSGNMNATNVVVSDPVPTNTTYVADSASNGGIFNGSEITWNIGTLVAGTSGVLTFQVTTDSNLNNNSTVSNTVYMNSDQGRSSDDEQTLVVRPVLEITKQVNKTQATPGDLLDYTINYRNIGGVAEYNAIITDSIDTNLTDIQPQDGGIFANNIISWSVGDVPADSSWRSVSFTAKIVNPLSNQTEIKNLAHITADMSDEDSNEVITIVISAPNIEITKTNSPQDAVDPDSYITYTIKVKNTGTENVFGYNLVDQWSFSSDEVAEFVAGSETSGAIVDTLNKTISWSLPEILVNNEYEFVYELKTNETNSNSGSFGIYNQACVNKSGLRETLSAQSSICTEETKNTVSYFAHLDLQKSVVPNVGEPGDTVSYEILVTNPGNAPAVSVQIKDILPDGFSYKTGTAKINGVLSEPINIHDNVWVWEIACLASGGLAKITYDVIISSSVTNGTYENLAVANAKNTKDEPEDSIGVKVSRRSHGGEKKEILGESIGPKAILGETLPATGIDWAVLLLLPLLFAGITIGYQEAKKHGYLDF